MLIGRKREKTKGPGSDLSKARQPKYTPWKRLCRNHGQSSSFGPLGERGALRLGLLLFLIVVLGGIGVLLLVPGGREPAPGPGRQAPTQATPRALDPTGPGATRQATQTHAEALADPPGDLSLNGGGLRQPTDPDRFQGRGRIRGSVTMSDNSALPLQWTLTARPSKILRGGESAEERQLEFLAGEHRFELLDLAFGSYDILANSAISNAQGMQIVLDRSNPNPFISIQMSPAGTLEGRLVDREGLPAAGVPILLISLPSMQRRRMPTDELGLYRFQKVLDGPYQLTVGEFESPILPRTETLRLQSPGMLLPDIELPNLAILDLHLVNEKGENLADVVVRGSGDHGGSIDAKTNIFGTLRVKHLPAGRYRLRFQGEGYRVRRSPIDLQLDKDNAYAVELLLE